MCRLCAIMLSLIITSITELRSQSSHDDFFPLSVGNRWTYFFSSFYHDDMEQFETTDSGKASYSITSRLTSSDSIVWNFMEVRQLSRHYKAWFNVDSTYPLTYTGSFYIVEYLSSNHRLCSSPYFSTAFEIAFRTHAFDSTSAYRYYPQQLQDSLFLSHIRYGSSESYDTLLLSLRRSRGPVSLFYRYFFPGAWGTSQLTLYDVVLVDVQEHEEPQIPSDLILQNNYPNPFNPVTTIPFSVPRSARATLRIYDLLGRHVSTLFDKNVKPGHYVAFWNAVQHSSGTYLCTLQANGLTKIIKITLLK